MLAVSSVSFGVSWARLPLNGGMLRVTPTGRISAISKPRSAITLSPGSRREMRPDLIVISLSDTRPDHSFDF